VRLHYDLATDLAVTGGLAVALITFGLAVKPALKVPTCSICDGDNGKVNAVDDFFRSSLKLPDNSPAGTVSDVFAYGIAPVAGIALATVAPLADKRGDEAPLDILLVMEAAITYGVVQQGISVALPRERPAAHAAEGEERASAVKRHSSFESFPAGHNGLAFTIAAAGGTVATMRGYRLAPLVWVVGGVIALTTSYLRIAADRHYFTDVSVGAVLGIGIGVAMPLLFHRPIKDAPRSAALRWLDGASVSTTEVPGGRIVGVGWQL
jgi:membrane-associated phospholipid phosphatase